MSIQDKRNEIIVPNLATGVTTYNLQEQLGWEQLILNQLNK